MILHILKLVFILFLFGDMFNDGYYKRTGKFNIFVSLAMYFSIMIIPLLSIVDNVIPTVKWHHPVILVFIVLVDQLMNNYWRKSGRLRYWFKWVIYCMMFFIGYTSLNYDGLFSNKDLYIMVLSFKMPISNIFYSIGKKSKRLIEIGETNVWDKLLHWSGLVYLEYETKFPAITIIYFFMIFIGIVIGL